MNNELPSAPKKASSPDDLNDCIRVAGTGVWLILAAVIVLLAGVCIWGIFGHVDTVAEATATVENNTASFYVEDKSTFPIPETIIAKLEGAEYVLEPRNGVSGEALVGSCEVSLPDGEYPAEIVLEREKPISFILN